MQKKAALLSERKKFEYYTGLQKKKKKLHERKIKSIQFHIFGVDESESEVRIEPLRHRKIFEIFDRVTWTDAIIETSPQHPIKNFQDFSKTHIDSKNSEKMHGHLW